MLKNWKKIFFFISKCQKSPACSLRVCVYYFFYNFFSSFPPQSRDMPHGLVPSRSLVLSVLINKQVSHIQIYDQGCQI